MTIDRSAFLAFVSLIASGVACGGPTPANAPPGAPAPTTSAPPVVAQPGPGTTGAESPTAAPTADVPAPPPTEAEPAELKVCDSILIGPCGEGGNVRENCKSNARNFDQEQARKRFSACISASSAKLRMSGPCADSVARCERSRQECDATRERNYECTNQVRRQCEEKGAKSMQCMQPCMGEVQGQSMQAVMSKMEACKKKCGDFEAITKQCEEEGAKRQCKALEAQAEACNNRPSCSPGDSCNAALSQACRTGFEAISACAQQARGK